MPEVPEEDAVRARLDALEAEVKQEADEARARKDAALVRVREQRAHDIAERQELRDRQADIVSRRARRPSQPEADADADHDLAGVDGALALARRADHVKTELVRPRKEGEKSWIVSGLLSLFFGPLGWNYAGSFREAIPAGVGWLLIAALFTKLPFLTFLVLPALLVILPLSGIAGVVYAMSYNKTGKRGRLFGSDKKKLPGKPQHQLK